MRSHFLNIVAIAALMFFGAGCLPATFVDVPAFKGHVVDAQSHPLQGISVRVITNSKGEEIALRTSSDGSFSFPGRSHFYFQSPIPVELETFGGNSLLISDGIHQTNSRMFWSRYYNCLQTPVGSYVDFGNIILAN